MTNVIQVINIISIIVNIPNNILSLRLLFNSFNIGFTTKLINIRLTQNFNKLIIRLI